MEPGLSVPPHGPGAQSTGFHRKLCVYSYHYRGRPEKPGLVFGLDRGGSCIGMAFEVAEEHWPATWDYLRKREQVTMVYREVFKPVRLREGQTVQALTYVVDRAHDQCAAGLADQEIAALVRQGEGISGQQHRLCPQHPCPSRTLGITDPALERIVALLKT